MDYFGESDSRKMPSHLFAGALRIDHASAVLADTTKQHYTVCPRHWYVDADFDCVDCGHEFTWSASEQQAWFEDYGFWIGSQPLRCKRCRATQRQLAELRKEYDAKIAAARLRGNLDQKRRIVEILEALEAGLGQLPEIMVETRETFLRKLAD